MKIIKNKKEAIDIILDQKIIAIFQGHSEWGARALGNRSFLFDPRNPKAKEIVKASHYGAGGRGYAGGTRSAGRISRPMSDIINEAKKRTVVIAQIEEAAGVDSINEIAAVEGLDAVFLGPSDLSLSYGQTDLDSQFLVDAMEKVGEAAARNKINYITFITDIIKINDWQKYGFTTYVLGSEHAWIMRGAQKATQDFKERN